MKEIGILQNRNISIGLQVAFWVLAYVTLWQGGQGPFAGVARVWLPIPFLAINAFLSYFNIYYLIPKVLFHRNVWAYLGSILLCLFVTFPLLFFLINSVTQEISVLVTEIGPSGESIITRRDPTRIKFAMVAGTSFTFLFISTVMGLGRQIVRRERERSQLERERLESEMKFLRAQINPHFLFNVMNNLYATVKLYPEQAGELISRISDMLRYVIYDCNQPKVSISQEIKYLKNYLYFQEMKDPDRMRIRLEEQIDLPHFQLEPMLLLPFVENAFKHGYTDDAAVMEVNISLRVNDSGLYFTCRNSLPEVDQPHIGDPSHSGIGIKNVRSRLDLSHPGKYQLLTQKDAAGYQITLKLTA